MTDKMLILQYPTNHYSRKVNSKSCHLVCWHNLLVTSLLIIITTRQNGKKLHHNLPKTYAKLTKPVGLACKYSLEGISSSVCWLGQLQVHYSCSCYFCCEKPLLLVQRIQHLNTTMY